MDRTHLGVEVWYLYHSGFAMKLPNRFLIFDYYNDTPCGHERGLAGGVIDPYEIGDLDVTVFASHRHTDHFNPRIFAWQNEIKNIAYILSFDIRSPGIPAGAVSVSPGKSYSAGGVNVKAIQSTDAGVAFLLEAGGLTIYHAGDLNWWHWEGEPERDNTRMAKHYRDQIDTLKGRHIDIAFVPLDPRQEKQYLWGLDYLMNTADVKTVFPMHFWDDFSALGWLQKDARAASYLDRVKIITLRGQKFEL